MLNKLMNINIYIYIQVHIITSLSYSKLGMQKIGSRFGWACMGRCLSFPIRQVETSGFITHASLSSLTVSPQRCGWLLSLANVSLSVCVCVFARQLA